MRKELSKIQTYQYFGARYYNSDISVWLSVDPLSDEYPSTSPYSYVEGNPIMFNDPTGMFKDWFQNENTGDLYYNSDMRAGDAGTGAMEGEGWVHLGENEMFKEGDDFSTSDIALLTDNGGNPQYSTNENGSVTVEGSINGDAAKSFMKSQGYNFNPIQQTIYDKSTESYVPGPRGRGYSIIYGNEITITEKSRYMKEEFKAIGKNQLSGVKTDGLNKFPYTTQVARYEITYSNNWLLKAASSIISLSKPLSGTHDYRMKRNYSSWLQYPNNIKLINDFKLEHGTQ